MTAAPDRAFAALADPTRRAILVRLAAGPATAGRLAAPFEVSQPAISKHLKVLADAGLIVRERHGTRVVCRLADGSLAGVEDWLATLRRAQAAAAPALTFRAGRGG